MPRHSCYEVIDIATDEGTMSDHAQDRFWWQKPRGAGMKLDLPESNTRPVSHRSMDRLTVIVVSGGPLRAS